MVTGSYTWIIAFNVNVLTFTLKPKDIASLGDENVCMYAFPLTISLYLTLKLYVNILYC